MKKQTYKRILSCILALIMLISMVPVLNVSAALSDLPDKAEGTYRYYFYMPPEWLNDSTATTGNTAGIYWWEGTDAHSSWPGIAATPADVDGVYYCDVPTDVTTIVWNNFFDGGADVSAPYYKDAIQTRNIGTEYYDPDESELYPDGTPNFDGMIYVTDFNIFDYNEYSGKLQFGGEWFYYYGNGEYGTSPVRGESEILTGHALNIDSGFPGDDEDDTQPDTEPDISDTGINVGGTIYNAEVGDTVTYTVDLMAEELFEGIQATITYDSEKLEIVRIYSDDPSVEDWEVEGPARCPNLDGVIFNAGVDGIVKFNASNPWDYFDFREESLLVTLEFIVKDTEYSEIDLLVEEMTIAGGYESYFTGGQAVITDGIVITESLTVPEPPVTEPDTEPDIEPSTPDEGIKVGNTVYNANVGDTITYTVDLMAARLFEDIQTIITYDSEKLELVRDYPGYDDWEVEQSRVPNISGAIVNIWTDGVVIFLASNVSGYNFKEEKVLVTLDFIVKDTGYSEIDLLIEEMTIKGDGTERYFTGGQAVITDGIVITESLTVPEPPVTEADTESTTVSSEPATVAPPAESEIDGLIYEIYDEEVWITGYDYDVINVEIPEEIEGYPVVGIDYYAFEYCTSLESITIPESVNYIGSDAFCGCSSLKSIVVPVGVSIIEFNTFSGCTSLESVVIPEGVTDIESYAFEDCTSLESVTIPDSITYIGQEAFADCAALSSITIGDGVASVGRNAFDNTAYYNNTKKWQNGVLYIDSVLIESKNTLSETYSINYGTSLIADFAFYECANLNKVNIPSTVTAIGEYAFADCSALESITIPSNVSDVGWSAFENCSGLKTMTIEHGATSEIVFAFPDCKNLEDVYYGGTEAQWKEFMFKDGIENLTQATIHFVEEPETEPTDKPEDPVETLPTEPPTTESPDPTEPPVTESTDPTEPTTTEPVETEPVETEPATTIPAETEPTTSTELIFPEDCLTDEKTNISVAGDTDAELVVCEVTSDKQIEDVDLILVGEKVSRVFDITLQKDGAEVQPDDKVMVRIPAENPDSKIYRMETDCTLTDMNAVYKDGYLIFITEHFSIYIVAEAEEEKPTEPEVTYLIGDSNGDGKINVKDATQIQKAVAGLVTLDDVQTLAADSDQNGTVNVRDATAIQKFVAGIPVNFPISEERKSN